MILEKVKQTIQKFRMLKQRDRVVIAVSGGPDSCALVYLLNLLKKECGLELHLAHLNHMIRQKEAVAEGEFVKNLANRLKLALTSQCIDVKNYARQERLSLEEAARKLRYNFLLEVAKKNCAFKIALGHNQDDQAETVLMRFIRGSGICGLRGIPATREWKECLIIRPLIELWRKEIIHFLEKKNIRYCIDSSNQDNFFLRNKVRNELLPYLERNFNPNIKETLVNFAENISGDFDFLEKKGQNRFRAVCKKSNGSSIAIDVNKFLSLHQALQKLVVRLAIKELKGDLRSIDYRHWKELEDLFQNRPKNSIVDFPKGVSIVKKRESLVFYNRNYAYKAKTYTTFPLAA
jgi:tRNA(Ile)-lysidine synthase